MKRKHAQDGTLAVPCTVKTYLYIQDQWLKAVFAVIVAFGSLLITDSRNIVYAFEFNAKNAILIDLESRSVLTAKEADAPVAPASMAKLMTLEVVFHGIRSGELRLDQEFKVSEHAWRTGGAPSRTATMFAELNSLISVENLIKGVAIHAANDAAIILAEGIAGSESAFAERMNARAAELGLTASNFVNPTGFANPDMTVSVSDLGWLAVHVLETYPDLASVFGEVEFTWNKIRQFNKNPLVRDNIEVDGFLAGADEDHGFGMVFTSRREGRRIIGVIHGLEDSKGRRSEATAALNWAFGGFIPRILFEDGEVVAEARVFGGITSHVPLLGRGPVSILVPGTTDERIRARVVYEGPIRAPVEKGARIGHIEIWRDELRAQETPLFAASDVPVGGLTRRALDGAQELLFGYW